MPINYLDIGMKNIKLTSRTASGTGIDTSASKEKQKMVNVLSDAEAANITNENVYQCLKFLYENKDRKFDSAKSVREFVEDVARRVTKGITKNDIFRIDDSTKYPYTLIANMQSAMDSFCNSLYTKLQAAFSYQSENTDKTPEKLKKNRDSIIEMAAWVDYRINLTDHFFADGCGKTSLLIGVYLFMRGNLPLIPFSEDIYKNEKAAVKNNTPNAFPKEKRVMENENEDLQFKAYLSFYQKLMLQSVMDDSIL